MGTSYEASDLGHGLAASIGILLEVPRFYFASLLSTARYQFLYNFAIHRCVGEDYKWFNNNGYNSKEGGGGEELTAAVVPHRPGSVNNIGEVDDGSVSRGGTGKTNEKNIYKIKKNVWIL